jgi:hypothetical protein
VRKSKKKCSKKIFRSLKNQGAIAQKEWSQWKHCWKRKIKELANKFRAEYKEKIVRNAGRETTQEA